MALTIITGANRGIGLALTRLLAPRGAVLAACRTPSAALRELDVEIAEGVDVAEEAGIRRLHEAVAERPIQLLINNAGILIWEEASGRLDLDGIRRQFEVNALGPLRVTQALREQLTSGSKVAFVTSRMGSITDNGSGGSYGYRMSKAALNMAAKSLAVDLRKKGVSVAILHPGLVKTDMVGAYGQVEPEEAARDLLQRIDELTLETTGGFWHANGEPLPW